VKTSSPHSFSRWS